MLRFGWAPDYTGRLVLDTQEKVVKHLAAEVDAALSSERVAFDTETNGLHVLKGARQFMYQFTYVINPKRPDINDLIRSKAIRKVPQGRNKPPLWVRSVAVFIGERHRAKPAARTEAGFVLEQQQRLLNGPAKIVMFNAKFDLPMCWADSVATASFYRDVYLDLFVLDPGFGDSLVEVRDARRNKLLKAGSPVPRNLKDLSWLLLGWPQEERDEVHAWLKHRYGNDKKKWQFDTVPTELVSTYGCGDTERTLALSFWSEDLIVEREQVEVADIESPLTAVVAEMELQGLPLHEEKIKETRALWTDKGAAAHDQMLELTGLASIEHTKDEHLAQYAWPALNTRAKQLGQPQHPAPESWSAEALSKFVTKKRGAGMAVHATKDSGVHGAFCEALLTQRAADKIIGTYLDPWVLTHSMRHDDGTLRVHCQLLQDGTDTGRFSSRNPNLQNVPVEARLLTAAPGHSLVFVDYSQIEFRIFAHYAGGPVLQAYLDDPHTDFHQAVADMIHIDRKPAKNINFAALYGMGEEKCITDLSAYMGRDDALDKYRTYHRKFPAARQLYNKCKRRMEERGWIKNLYGRRRYLPKEHAQKALNTLCQGGAADIVKAAMLRVDTAIRESDHTADWVVLLQIHDELIFMVPTGQEQALIDFVSPIMVDEPRLKVPLLVEAEVCYEGEVWKDKHKIVSAAA